jgi:hypothetical protein
MKHFKSFKLGNLYHRFIKGTQLEKLGWTGERLAIALESLGYIRLVTVQSQDSRGRFIDGVKKYIEEPGRYLSKQDFKRRVLPTILGGMV